MANIDVLFKMRPKKNIYDVLFSNATLDEVLLEVRPGVWLLPGGSGFRELQSLSFQQRMSLMDGIAGLRMKFDYLLIDTAPGISETVLHLNSLCQQNLVIITPDPSSFADSYALIKFLTKDYRKDKISVLCHYVDDLKHREVLFRKFSEVVFNFLNVSLDHAGSIPMDCYLRRDFQNNCSILRQGHRLGEGQYISLIGQYLEGLEADIKDNGGTDISWNQLVELSS